MMSLKVFSIGTMVFSSFFFDEVRAIEAHYPCKFGADKTVGDAVSSYLLVVQFDYLVDIQIKVDRHCGQMGCASSVMKLSSDAVEDATPLMSKRVRCFLMMFVSILFNKYWWLNDVGFETLFSHLFGHFPCVVGVGVIKSSHIQIIF